MGRFLQRTWAEVNLDAVEDNYRLIRGAIEDSCKLMCIVKADAYGHGAEYLAREYERLGADWFGVSNIEEAMQLRNAGIQSPILILGYTPASMADKLAPFGLTQTVLSLEYAEALSRYAVKYGVTVPVHVKVDTGMSRIGLMYQNKERDGKTVDEIEAVCRLPRLEARGIFTHFAVSDDGTDGRAYTEAQFDLFCGVIEALRQRGVEFELRHCCNSGGVLDYPDMHRDMVRAGIILYGLLPSEKTAHILPLKPAMQLKTVVSMLKDIQPGTTVSYGRAYTAEKPLRVATVPIGYADGYLRCFAGKADMLVRGQRAPVIGRVCMDQLMLDVSAIPEAAVGSVVTVFGADRGNEIPVEELAGLAGTINYELICLVGKRVPRVYYKGGRSVGHLDYILQED